MTVDSVMMVIETDNEDVHQDILGNVQVKNTEVVETRSSGRIVLVTGYPGDIEDAIGLVSWAYPSTIVTLTMAQSTDHIDDLPERYYYRGGLRQLAIPEFPPFEEDALFFEVNDFDDDWLRAMADRKCGYCNGFGVEVGGRMHDGSPAEEVCRCVEDALRARGGSVPW